MSARAALRGSFAVAGSAAIAFCCVFAAGCDDTTLKRVNEDYALVGGEPRIDPSLPTVDRTSGEANAADFGTNAPVQVDVFNQTQVAKVDILWVVDNSGSMSRKQQKVKQNFQAFVAKLVENNESLDYHIGVVTTDTYNPNESGRLVNKAGLPKPWVGPDTCPRASCDPVAKFNENVSVGTTGSGDEKGLLAAMLALSPPLTTNHNAGFLRDDAALFIIILSDEEDSSCSPIRTDRGGCLTPVSFGQPNYYSRFFEGLKGFGRREHVTVGAIVALEKVVNGVGTGQGEEDFGSGFTGCKSSDDPVYPGQYAPRYIEVAKSSGGLATSICDADYLPALQNLGFLATGAKTSFLLSRAPYADSIQVLVRKPGEATPTLQVRGTDYDYEPCAGSGGGVLNAIRFRASALPPAGSTIEVEYPVNVRGVTCQ